MDSTPEAEPVAAREAIPSGSVPLGEAYRRAIDEVESLAHNRSGADKTWVELALREFRAHYSRVERVR